MSAFYELSTVKRGLFGAELHYTEGRTPRNRPIEAGDDELAVQYAIDELLLLNALRNFEAEVKKYGRYTLYGMQSVVCFKCAETLNKQIQGFGRPHTREQGALGAHMIRLNIQKVKPESGKLFTATWLRIDKLLGDFQRRWHPEMKNVF